MSFNEPTPIQAQAIPFALEGRDILGSAQTGTGKTAAFSIPAIVHVLNNPKSNVLILTPTRELAAQVLDHIKKLLGRDSKISTALLIGGESMDKQFKQLRSRPRIVVGTPGRINDHLIRKTLVLSSTDFLILDETDRMLDMGFVVQLEEIFPKLAETRQTLMFSATFSPSILRMATDYLVDPERISVGSTSKPIETVTQESIQTTDAEKYNLLTEKIAQIDGSFIVFLKTKRDTEKLVERMRIDGYEADAIHGDLKQSKRDRVIQRFRAKKTHVLVATDVAARGLDVPHIECVVNYDLPHCPEDYIHRIGRTGRAGSEGVAVNFITSQDRIRWRNICKLLDPQFKEERKPGAHSQDDNNRRRSRPHSKEGRNPRFSGEKREFGERKPFGEKREFGERKFSGERGAFGERKSFGEKREFGEKKFSGERRSSSEKGSFGEKRDFGGKRFSAEKNSFGEKSAPSKKRSFGNKSH